ncbi:MAG: hypothetical protein RIS47_2339 [Bacteroidota bacterium]|jgi:Leucine-rich repeat (LRR) protein
MTLKKMRIYTLYIWGIAAILASCSPTNQQSTTPPSVVPLPSPRLLSDTEISNATRYETLEKALLTPDSVTRLILWNQTFSQIPKGIGQLQMLNSLEISHTPITELSEELANIEVLQNLYLNQNKLSVFPKILAKLKHLKRLNISENTFTDYTGLSQLDSLQEIRLTRMDLDTIPNEIWKLTQLKELRLSRNNIKKLPAEIVQLTSLESLDLANNKLTSLPKELSTMQQLKYIRLESNPLLPEVIKQLRKALPNTEIKF